MDSRGVFFNSLQGRSLYPRAGLQGTQSLAMCGASLALDSHSPVTAEVRKMGARLSVFMFLAQSSTSSTLRTRNGFFFTPGFFRMDVRFWTVCLRMCSGAMSTLVMTKNTGT